MRRQEWFELHDHPLYPGFLRDLVTDALQALWNAMGIYNSVAPLLRSSILLSGAKRVIDLCSGGGGPWLGISRELQADDSLRPSILLTDKYPTRSDIRNVQNSTGGRMS